MTQGQTNGKDKYRNEIGPYKKHFNEIIISDKIKFPIEFSKIYDEKKIIIME